MTQVPKVSRCEMAECGFNQDMKCHAAAIQVGDPLVAEATKKKLQDPKCDTFTVLSGRHLGAPDLIAQVGACKADTCTHNVDLRCTAQAIQVGHHQRHADCQTYESRSA